MTQAIDCLVVQPIAAPGLARLRAAGLAVHVAASPDLEHLRPHLATARAVITRNAGFSAAAIAAAPKASSARSRPWPLSGMATQISRP